MPVVACTNHTGCTELPMIPALVKARPILCNASGVRQRETICRMCVGLDCVNKQFCLELRPACVGRRSSWVRESQPLLVRQVEGEMIGRNALQFVRRDSRSVLSIQLASDTAPLSHPTQPSPDATARHLAVRRLSGLVAITARRRITARRILGSRLDGMVPRHPLATWTATALTASSKDGGN